MPAIHATAAEFRVLIDASIDVSTIGVGTHSRLAKSRSLGRASCLGGARETAAQSLRARRSVIGPFLMRATTAARRIYTTGTEVGVKRNFNDSGARVNSPVDGAGSTISMSSIASSKRLTAVTTSHFASIAPTQK